jgi:hypothetical protein
MIAKFLKNKENYHKNLVIYDKIKANLHKTDGKVSVQCPEHILVNQTLVLRINICENRHLRHKTETVIGLY